MRTWLRAGGRAAVRAARRGDLWAGGALAEIVPLAWLPLAVAVIALPSLSEITFAGVEFATAPELTLRVAAVISVALGLLLLIRLVAAFGEAAVVRGSVERTERPAPGAVAADAGAFVVIEVVAFIPALLAGAALLAFAADVAPRVWQRPDLGGVDAAGRLLSALAPNVVVFVAVLVVGHVMAAAGRTALADHPGRGVGAIVRAAWRTVAARPLAALGVSVVALVARLAFFVAASVLLRFLWHPIAARIGDAELWAPATLALLIGFVFAWLCIVAASGVLHVWVVGWWVATFGGGRGEAVQADSVGDGGARWTPRPSSS